MRATERSAHGDQRKTWFWFACVSVLFGLSVIVAVLVSEHL